MDTRPFDTSLSPIVQAAGRNVFYVEGTATGTDDGIVISPTRGGGTFELRPGQGVSLPVDNLQNFQLEVLPRTPGAVVRGKLLIGNGDFRDQRITGDVNVIDNNVAKTRMGNQFIHSCTIVANATNLSGAGLVAKAGKLAIVKRIVVASPTAGVVQILRTGGQGTANPDLFAGANKNIFAANSNSRLVGGNFASVSPTVPEIPSFNFWLAMHIPANDGREIPLTTPVVLEATEGILLSSFVINREVSLIVDWEEIDP